MTEFWVKIGELYDMEDGVKKLRFDLLSNFCVSVLTIPHSTAEIERIFSVLGNI